MHPGHDDLDRLNQAWLDARRVWQVALRVHLSEVHDIAIGDRDPDRVHRDLHS